MSWVLDELKLANKEEHFKQRGMAKDLDMEEPGLVRKHMWFRVG